MKRYPVLSALLVCGASGVLFSFLRTPLPWMIGPLLGMACGKFMGIALASPKGGRAAGQVVIGCALGLYFSPLVALEVVAHWYLLIAAALLAVLLAYASGWFLSRSAGLDATTALFASVPGGAAEMTILGERFGAQSDRVVMAQSLRILLVIVIVPFAIAAVGAHGADAYEPPQRDVSVQGLVAMLAIAIAAGGLLKALKMPNAWMLGPLAVTIALTVSEVRLSAMPPTLSNAAQVLLGCALGSGFQRDSLRSAPRFMAMVCISVVIAIVLSALFGWGVALAGAVPTPTMVLATAPGGMAEMCITAKVLQLGVPLVTAAHVTRVIILVTTIGPIFRLARHMRRKLQR
jgi:membrane AbrB-like protein